MTWRDRYTQGSFRGVKFFTRSHSTQVGQRRAIYEIPLDSTGARSVDLGRKPRRFRITASLLGDNADLDAKALMTALEQPGPGLLVHPRFGSVMVLPGDSISIDEDTTKGGELTVSFEATESSAKAPAAAAVVPDARSSLASKTDALKVANKAAFEAAFSVEDALAFVRDNSLAQIEVALEALQQINGTISAVLSVPGEAASAIDRVSLETAQLLDTPGDLYDALAGAVNTVFGAISRVAGRLGLDVDPSSSDASSPAGPSLAARSLVLAIKASDLAEDADPPGDRDTPARALERVNHAAIRTAMHVASLAAIAAAANDLTFTSKTEAETARDLLLAELDAALARSDVDANVFDAIEDTRAAVRARLSNLSLASITTYQPFDTLPADVIAWQLYGNAERSDEIVQRNDIATPGAVPSHLELEVLSE